MSGAAGRLRSVPGSVSLVGRAAECGALERWLATVAAGRAGLGLAVGEAGIGKSRVAGVACELAAARSFTVFTAVADELEQGRPFGVLGDALAFVPKVPAGATAVPGLEYRLVDELVERVEDAALRRPVVVVLEDLHWADPATVVALRALGRRLAHLPIGLLVTFRPSPRPVELDRLIDAWRDDGALYLPLAPLEHRSVIELASELVGGRPGEELERQLLAAAGNPLFVTELLGALSEDGAIELVDGVAVLSARSLPPSLRLTILRRVGALGGSTLALLRTASVLGRTFSLVDVATVTGRVVGEVVDELMEARRAGVVEDAGALLRFRHDLVREALYRDLPESARRALHRDAGRLLADAGAPALQVAEHLSLGASPGDLEAVWWLCDAARESLLRAPQTAVVLLERAAELAPVGDPARDRLLADLADALVWCGRPGEGQSLAADLLARGVPAPMREQARGTVVRGLWLDGRWQALLEQIERWIELTGPELPAEVRGTWLANGAMAALFSGDAARAETMALEALEIGESLGEAAVEFQALYALGPVHNFRGRKDQELAASMRALAIVERGENPDLVRFHPHFAVAMSLAGQDRHDEAEQMFMTGMRVREELGTVWDLALYQAGLAELHCEMGKWDDALVEADTGLAIAEEVGTRLQILVCAGVAAMIHAHRDDLAEAGRYLEIAEREIERSGPQWGAYWTILAAAQLADAHGDSDRALRALHDAWAANEDSPGLRVYLAPALVRAALLVEDLELARSVADAVGSYVQPGDVATAVGHALLARGAVDREREVLARAVEMFRQGGWLHGLGIACETAATAIAEQHDSATARPLFDEALGVYERLGARLDTARTLSAMRACGLRRGSRAAHRRALKGWDSLTAMESDVVRLTVEGLTNRQIGERLFISRRTVQTHLAHAFTKLDVSSRVELATAAQRHASA
jgi:DNA-binding CsgD family transcriptional regulator